MPINKEQIFRVLIDVCEEAEIYVTAKESVKGALIAGATTFVGGLLMGPPGLAVGGTVGGLLAYSNSGNFRPVSKVLMELPEKKKDYLIQNFSSIVSNLKATDAIMLLAIIRADQVVYQKVIEFIKDFITSDLHMGIKT